MADSALVNKSRTNIRIQIENNLMESMDVDETHTQSDGEEGEIIEEEAGGFDDYLDDNITYPRRPSGPSIEPQKKPRVSVSSKGFATGINIFDKEEQGKLSERAKRFAIDPKQVTNFTEEDLIELHNSLGISTENEKDLRFEAVHMHGTDDMSSKNVLEYFSKYSPTLIEWVSDESCNVVWEDKITAARAIFFLSKPIKGMPVEGSCDPFSESYNKNKEKESSGGVLKNKHREVELEEDEAMDEDKVSVSDIPVPIPPGYWRLGVAHADAKCILLRFALKSDKKPFKAEKFSEYYKKYGNPNFGGLKGIISESKKAQFRSIFDRNKEINSKNPWGDLAKTWHTDRQREEIVNPTVDAAAAASKMSHRLGFKRSQDDAFKDQAVVEEDKKLKMPRMRMYADEEEEKIKRKKKLEALKKLSAAQAQQSENVLVARTDLRQMIRKRDHEETDFAVDKEVELEEEVAHDVASEDLGSRLTNRRMKHHADAMPSPKEEPIDIRHRLEQTKQHRFRDELLKHKNKPKRYKSPPPPPRHRSRHNPKYSTYSDDDDEEEKEEEGVESAKDEDMYVSDEDPSMKMKTNSKVTVVIKKQKQPAVASTVWSRVNTNDRSSSAKQAMSVKDRLHSNSSKSEVSDGRVGRMRSRASEDSSDSSSSSSSDSDSDSETSEDDDDDDEEVVEPPNEDRIKPSIVNRPGFRNDLASEFKTGDHKSPLRIEINNDHYQK